MTTQNITSKLEVWCGIPHHSRKLSDENCDTGPRTGQEGVHFLSAPHFGCFESRIILVEKPYVTILFRAITHITVLSNLRSQQCNFVKHATGVMFNVVDTVQLKKDCLYSDDKNDCRQQRIDP